MFTSTISLSLLIVVSIRSPIDACPYYVRSFLFAGNITRLRDSLFRFFPRKLNRR